MKIIPPNRLLFVDLNDLILNYFYEMGMSIDKNGYLYDQDIGNNITFKGNMIKVSVNGIPVYAGMNEIVFDPIHNYGLISTLFGTFLDKCQKSEEGDILGGYIAHGIEDDKGSKKQRVCVKTLNRGEIASEYYNNVFLAYIDCTFRISGYDVNLTNFDIDYIEIEEKEKERLRNEINNLNGQ